MPTSDVSRERLGLSQNLVYSVIRGIRTSNPIRIGGWIMLSVLATALNAQQQRPGGQAQAAQAHSASQASGNMSDMEMTNIPYFSQSGGMRSVLTLNNNTPSERKVEVTIFNSKGKPLVVSPISLKLGVTDFALEDLIKNADGFGSGNIEVMYEGNSMAVTCQVGVFLPDKRISFGSRDTDMMDFLSSQLNGIVWLPDLEAEGFLALTNTTAGAVTVDISLGAHSKELVLTSRETRLLNLRRDFNEQNQRRENRAVLLKLKHNGAPGAIIGTGFVLNVTTGYSSNFALVDPATSRSSKLAGADVRFGYADVTEGFPVGTKFRAPLVLGNVSTKPLRARVSVDYTLGGTPTSLGVGEERILPGELRVIELTEELARLGITGPVDDAGVDIIHDGAPGSLIAHLTSVDQTGDYSFEVPIKDPSETAHMSLNRYPWTLRDGTKTVLHLKNTTARTVGAQVEFRFLGGIYNRGRIQLQPFQTLAVDIQKLKDSGQKDAIGSVFPKQAMSGQVEWFEEMPKSIIGRAEQVNVAAGTARSFSCGTCPCNPSIFDAAMSPTSVTKSMTDHGVFFTPTYNTEDCNGVITAMNPAPLSERSGWVASGSAATVDQTGKVSCVAPGSSTISVTITHEDQYWTGPIQNTCGSSPQHRTPSGALTVRGPDHVKVVLDQAGFPGACPTTGIYVRQMQMQVVDASAVSQTNNPSIKEAFSPAQPSNSCGNGSPVPPSCSPTGPTGPPPCPSCGPGQFLDTLSVSRNFCGSGINRNSGCGYTHTSTWSACSTSGSNTLWTSPRITHSNGVTVNSNSTTFAPGTQIH